MTWVSQQAIRFQAVVQARGPVFFRGCASQSETTGFTGQLHASLRGWRAPAA
jgi:hypothetical protein